MKTSIAPLLAILIVTSCVGPAAPASGGSILSTPSAVAPSKPLFVMIAETGCAASPASTGSLNGGRNVWTLRNGLEGLASFQLMRIDGSYGDAAGWFRERASVPNAQPAEPPFIAEELSRVVVAPGATELLTDDLGPGVHAIVCFVLDEHEDVVATYLAGPFTVAAGA